MMIAKARFEPAGERFVGEQAIEVHRRFGNADTASLGRNTAMQVSQRFGVTQPFGFGHDALNQVERSEEHTSELQSLMRISYAVFCLKKKTHQHKKTK